VFAYRGRRPAAGDDHRGLASRPRGHLRRADAELPIRLRRSRTRSPLAWLTLRGEGARCLLRTQSAAAALTALPISVAAILVALPGRPLLTAGGFRTSCTINGMVSPSLAPNPREKHRWLRSTCLRISRSCGRNATGECGRSRSGMGTPGGRCICSSETRAR
jgi:hypothetical protein